MQLSCSFRQIINVDISPVCHPGELTEDNAEVQGAIYSIIDIQQLMRFPRLGGVIKWLSILKFMLLHLHAPEMLHNYFINHTLLGICLWGLSNVCLIVHSQSHAVSLKMRCPHGQWNS